MIEVKAIDFLKLHGLGNDFILIDERAGECIAEDEKHEFSAKFCDRHKGIGADGVLFIGPYEKGISFRIFNADGSEAEMCVNGLRCVSLALRLRLDPEGSDEVEILTQGGIVRTKIMELKNDLEGTVEVHARFDPKYLGQKRVKAGGRELDYHITSVGNPHAVTFLEEDVSSVDVEGIGHAMEYHKEFQPEGVNTEFVNRLSPGRLRMRVHERGACETLACGSGAIAAATAAQHLEPDQISWMVEMPGGQLEVIFRENTIVRGLATLSFEGRFYY